MDQLLANDIFLLMLNLSQLRDEAEIIRAFLETLNGRLTDLKLDYVPDEPEGGEADAVAVATAGNRFGWVRLRGDPAMAPRDTLTMVRNAVAMLALVLENRLQARMLRDENIRLDHLVSRRAQELLQANQRLHQEVEERRKAEEALRRSEENYRDLFQYSNDAVLVHDPQGRLLDVNQRACQMLGWSRGDLLNKSISDLIPEKEWPAFEAARACLRAEGQVRYETRLQGAGGLLVEVDVSARPVDRRQAQIKAVMRDITQWKRTARELGDTRLRLQQLFDHMADGVAVYQAVDGGADFKFVDYNRAAERLSHVTKSEVLGRRVTEVFPYVKGMGLLEVLSRVWHSGQSAHLPLSLYKEGRVELWVENYVYKLPSGLVVAIFNDTSEQQRAVQALRLSEERLRLAMEATEDGLWDWNVATGRIAWSPRCYTMLGYQPDEFPMSLDKWFELVHPDDRDQAWKAVREKMAHRGDSFSIEFRYRAKDGDWRWIIGRGRGVDWDQEGNPIRMIGTHLDITERKRSEQIIQDMSQRFQRLVESLPEGVVVHTGDTIQYVNQAAVRIFGAQGPQDLIGTNIFDRLPPQRHALIRERMRQVHATNLNAPPMEHAYRRLDGTSVDVEVSAVPTMWQGRRSHLVIIRDITERKRMEAEKGRLELQLRQAQKMEAIGTLAGGVAHDFNNILAGIMGYTEFALDSAQEGIDCSAELKQVISAAGRARDLVRQILTFSRKVEFQPQPLDLNREVHQIREVLGHTLPKMIEIVCELAPDLRPAHADANQVEQVLLNLGGNAADAMPQGGRLTIRTENATLDEEFCRNHLEANPGDYVLLTVSDTGHGMDEKTRQQIFDPFFSTKQPGKGTGLGLSTVYGIVTGHEGHIFCSSRPGHGTAFSIYLPALLAGSLPAETARRPARPQGGDERILLVDDEEALRQVGAALLTRAGYTVHTATSGEEALDIFRRASDEVDLVVLDLGMPGMGGLKCLGELLLLDPATRVLIASGYAADGQIQQSLKRGAAGYIAKPYRKGEMLAAVRRVLDQVK